MPDIVRFEPTISEGPLPALPASSLANLFSVPDSKSAKAACKKKSALLHVSSYEIDDGDLIELSRGKGAIIFSFSDILGEHGFRRAILLSKMRLLLSACRKTGAGFVFASMAKNADGVRNARELVAFAYVVGAGDVEIKAAQEALERFTSGTNKVGK